MLFGPEITSKLIKIYLVTESLPKSVQYLINNRKFSIFLSKKIFTVYRDKFEKAAKLKDDEGAQKRLEALTKFLRFIEATGNISLSENFQLSFKALKLALSNPKKYILLSHLYLAINSGFDFYIASKLLKSKSKKLFEDVGNSGDNPNEFIKESIAKIENSLKVTTFQEFFQTYMKLELEDIAYDSKKFDFYIDDGDEDEWDLIEQISPQSFSAEFFGLRSKKEIEKKSKTIKRYGLSKFGRRRVKKRRVYASLLGNIEYSTSNSLRPKFAAEGSYIQFEKFSSINRVYQRIKGLQVEEKPLVFLDSSLVFQFLLEFEANNGNFPLWLVEQILNRFKFVCLPGVLYDLEKVGYNEFVREFLKKIIDLPKLLEIENYLNIYQNKLSEYGFNNLNVEILSSEEYWRFYVQFHACLAKLLNSSYLLIPLDLKKYYFNKNYYNGKFSIFNGNEFNATILECLTAKKFEKKFKVNKEKAVKTEKESNNLESFVVSSNFKEWAIPNCLNEVLKELDRKLIEEVNSFWLETFRNEENQQKNEVYFNDFFELIKKFEKNKNILKKLPGYSTFFEEQEYYRAKFTDINEYIQVLKTNFEYFVDINNNYGVINSEELYFLLFLFESTVANFLKDRFYLKAKHKSPTLPTSINFNLFYKDLDTLSLNKKFNYRLDRLNQLQLSNSNKGLNNNAQKINIKSKKRNERIFEFVPNLQYNNELMALLFDKFLFSRYVFHKSELNAIYSEFIKFIRAKKEYRNIAKGFSYGKFETMLKNSYEKILTLIEPYDIYYSKRLEDFLLLVDTYHRVREDSFPLELAAKILNISETELEILIYSLIQKDQMYREKNSLHPKYSLFFQAVKELHNNYGENNEKVAKAIPRIIYTPFCISNKNKNATSSQPELWIENSKGVLDNAPIYSINAKNRVSYANQLFEVEIKGEMFATDVDTGAFKSLLSKEIADRLFPNKTRFKAYVSGYTQNTKCVEMIKNIPFYFNKHKFTDDFLIEEDIERIFKVEVVIGRDGYNNMLRRYYGKTLDTLFEKDNADGKTNEIQIPLSDENNYRNSRDSLIKEAKSISKEVFVVQRGSAILTRKFALIPTKTNPLDRNDVYTRMTDIFVKITALKNLYIKKHIERAKSGNLGDFKGSGKIDARRVYDSLNLSSLDGSAFSKSATKSFKLKERVKQCANFDAFNIVRNWLVRNENLRVILSFLISKLENDNEFALKFLAGKRFSSGDLSEIRNLLKTNCFDRKQSLSTFYLNNHIYQLRNIFLNTVDFTSDSLHNPQNKIQQNFAEIFSNLSASTEFLELIANGFTKKKERKIIIVPEDELLKHLLNQYFRKIKWNTNGLARRIIALRNKIDKVSLQKNADKRKNLIRQLEVNLKFIEKKLFSFIEPFQFATKQEFRRKRDLRLDDLKAQFQVKLDSFKIKDLYQLIAKEFDNEVASIYESNNNFILKRLFKPSFPLIRILDVSFDSLTQYIKTHIRYRIRENLKHFFTTDNITDLFIDEFKRINSHLYDMVSVPKVRKFSLSLIMPEIFRENYSKYDEGLDILAFKIGFISRQFIPFKIIDKKNRLRKQLDSGFSPANPTITFKNRKLLLNLPFEIKKGEFNPSQEQDSNNPNIEMGIDLGLKHFAVVCVWDKKQNLDLARYFIGTRQLFDKKLVERDGVLRWQYQDRFQTSPYNKQSNVKLKLINLRKQIKQLQRKKNNYEQRLLERGITNFRNKLKWNKIRRELSLCWDRLNRLNKQIVDLLNNCVLKIARFWKVSTIKMENLRWSTHSKKRDAGKFMAFWQTHWFYSRVQEAIKFQCDLNSIRFLRVPAQYTSQRCSRCGELGSRASKRFSCSSCGMKLDSDLNASRNVVKTQNNSMYCINQFDRSYTGRSRPSVTGQ